MIEAKLIDHMGTDLSVVNAARVSFDKKGEWETEGYKLPLSRGQTYAATANRLVLSKKDTNLINYLADHKHMSPFGHCFASFHVKAPIFVARQLVKHKFLRWNEVSRRYVDSEPEFYEPDIWRGKSEDKKQGSFGEITTSCIYDDCGELTHPRYVNRDVSAYCLRIYNQMILKGVAPEQARMVLPQTTMTEWYWSGSLDAFSDMCNLRCKEDTQYESRLVANQIDDIMGNLYPVSWKALRQEKVTITKDRYDSLVETEWMYTELRE